MGLAKLYAHPQSPPSRTVTLALDVFRVDYKFQNVDILSGEARKPEFLKVKVTK